MVIVDRIDLTSSPDLLNDNYDSVFDDIATPKEVPNDTRAARTNNYDVWNNEELNDVERKDSWNEASTSAKIDRARDDEKVTLPFCCSRIIQIILLNLKSVVMYQQHL